MNEPRPIVAAIHPNLIEEFKIRKKLIEDETGRKTKGGITCFSEMAAFELKLLRLSGDELMKNILKIKNPPIKRIIENDKEVEYVPYEYFKKIYIYTSLLNKKKDTKQFSIQVTKLKGINKNEINFF